MKISSLFIYHFLFLLIFLSQSSRIFWYDIKGIFIFSGGVNYISVFFKVYALSLIPVVLYYLRIVSRTISSVEFLLLYFNFMALAVGIFNANPVNYIAGDFFKFLLCIATYYIFKQVDTYEIITYFGKKIFFLYWVLLFFAVGRLIMFNLYFHAKVGFIFGTVQDLLLLFLAIILSFVLLNEKRILSSFFYFSLFFFSIYLVLLGQKRSTIFALIIAFLYWNFRERGRRILKYIFWFVPVIVIITLLVLEGGFDIKGNFQRYKNTDILAKITEDGRYDEFLLIKERIRELSAISIISGKGHGAVFDKYVSRSGRIETIHSVHITPVAVFYRYGIIGILFYLFLLCVVGKILLQQSFRELNVYDTYIYMTMQLYILVCLIFNFGIFGMIDDPLFFMFLSLLKNKSYDGYLPC